MTTNAAGTTGCRMRLAISSPEIVARIRDVFASRGLDVVLDDVHPTFEVTVVPGPGARPAPAALGDALSHLVGARARREEPTVSARYRLRLAAAPEPCSTGPRPGAGTAARVDGLSSREAQVMACIARGLRNGAIGAELGVTEKTVKNHVNRIFAKLGARDRVEAVLVWQSAGDRRGARAGVSLAG
ncbi:helix-turn-helix transcriptional regulator [Cellulomonas shaoxiangyii]|uniref:LuxR family transcriptional regulator n=1 Tax=Cellulomonas shaoxiangyii TaxID=2566013 RepID=A0A4P7SL17_9CELL|nr:LuxR C-terminal-related transcriptional regulator [Cellulomonas shaoxiangyii]QCB94910.1 LuxR family transcriptional regulator [Cellulomonas shaoxiangyii]TGY76923.1 LuxR family transcriptional regulator [Cellulomonas shaoxiangyii]